MSMSESSARQWTLLLSLTALLLSLAVLAQIATRYLAAYRAAPSEVQAFVDTVDSSVAENESYDRDVAKVQRLEDKLRLGRLLRDIQKHGDDLREDLNRLLMGEDSDESRPTLRTGARVLWASKRVELEERVRRIDMLRMRFLVVHMGIIAGSATDAAPAAAGAKKHQALAKERDPEKIPTTPPPVPPALPRPGMLPRSLTDSIKARPPLRRLATQAIGHQEHVETPHRKGWAGVIQELQKSPLMHKRHATIESAMAEPDSP